MERAEQTLRSGNRANSEAPDKQQFVDSKLDKIRKK